MLFSYHFDVESGIDTIDTIDHPRTVQMNDAFQLIFWYLVLTASRLQPLNENG